MSEEFNEYVTFTITTRDGSEVELAVVEEFEYDHKTYVAGAIIEGDTINEDGVYLYRANIVDGELKVEQIDNKNEYEAVAEAFSRMDEE